MTLGTDSDALIDLEQIQVGSLFLKKREANHWGCYIGWGAFYVSLKLRLTDGVWQWHGGVALAARGGGGRGIVPVVDDRYEAARRLAELLREGFIEMSNAGWTLDLPQQLGVPRGHNPSDRLRSANPLAGAIVWPEFEREPGDQGGPV